MAGSRDPHEYPVPDLSRPENRHEHRDVNVWAVYKFGIGLALLCVLACALLFGVYKYFLSREGGPLAQEQLKVDARNLPPAPRLQPAPIADIKDMMAAEDRILNGYGWVDREKGVTHIPIDRAIDLLAQRGVPSRPQPHAASGVSMPTESGPGTKVQPAGEHK
jgi:hypothetical protein